jgi:hypothetical protein
MDENQNKFILLLAIYTEFFNAHLPIFVRCKTKREVSALCALLRKRQLGACQLLIAVRDGTVL